MVGFVLGLVVILVISGLTVANAISTDLSDAVVVGAGFLSLIMLFGAIKMFSGGAD